ncbi:helix-turn-helix domain-containing protein [Sinorhizobium terangae]|uniref:helix-turn-helix domain-containing protein n=1 Tax=Sinorhizobium terangae TaxID=110322 RepID=UPI00362D9F3A
MAISDIARRLKLPKSIAYRFLSILVDRDFATQDTATQHYRLAIRTAALGLRFFGNIGLNEACQPILNRLAQRTGEFVRVCAAKMVIWFGSLALRVARRDFGTIRRWKWDLRSTRPRTAVRGWRAWRRQRSWRRFVAGAISSRATMRVLW